MTRLHLTLAALSTVVLQAWMVDVCTAESMAVPARTATELRVAAVQMRSTRNLATNIHKIQKYLADCAKNGVRVAVFPECALTGYFDDAFMKSLSADQLVDAERQVAKSCQAHHIYAIVGTPYRKDGRIYNSAVVISPDGLVRARYCKLQLAETWPMAGQDLLVFRIDGVPSSIIICHDERYPELVRLPVLAGARVIFYLSHEGGLIKESKLAPYRAQIQARAVENTVYVVQANAPANSDGTGSHGQSRVIAPDGNLVKEASFFDEDVVAATLELDRATGRLAKQSVNRGPLADWWRQGIAQVRSVDDPLPLILNEDFEHGFSRWQTTDPKNSKPVWKIIETGPKGNHALRVTGPGSYKPPFRSPFSIALLKDINVSDFELTAHVQQTRPDAGPHRDLCFFWGYQDPAHFYYAHLASTADEHACQIFIVNNAPRTKITKVEANGTPWTTGWHDVKVIRRVDDGVIEVYFDDMKKPFMTARDRTFVWGQVGVGTFDDNGNFDNVILRGNKVVANK